MDKLDRTFAMCKGAFLCDKVSMRWMSTVPASSLTLENKPGL